MTTVFEPHCMVCEKPIAFGELICNNCTEKFYSPSLSDGDFKVYHYGKYQYPLSNLIIEFKYHSHPKIARLLGNMLAKFFIDLKFPELNYTVSYVPSNYSSIYEKGFVPARLIAQHFSDLLGFPLINLFSSKTHKRQAQLNYRKRNENVKNKIKLLQTPPKNIIIIDDVYTTGASMNEAGSLLINKCDVLIGITVAKAYRYSLNSSL
ncbi:MAG TPA: hypothetical protein DEA49_03930 [Petrotoga sp.]|nr:MAG: Phosphoribosyltransferase [Petrotoga mobilis]HBT51244.1 hypothetical protein [Petrotoga sp.]